ncbi:antibiotic biosynthesis monooxygenase [Tardiphaga alba]|uniref:Antibiotic biosynthesis monooxygenase n=1 Tax=Tardiphaga alba TaxID=340268 RepID=A0ABX8ADR8_9BRAD|nr:antibiotic biosynthesis monooxygenase [Tardiphaga alba]QUS41911.1 antibiotic biosynthesis monooxygenase [Tardiphaga alba]
MITELAILRIRSDAHAGFEAAFARVAPLLARAEGHVWHRLVATADHDDFYLLEVAWRDLAAHTEHFEPSSAHTEFMEVLGPFLVDEPVVIHVPTATRLGAVQDEDASGDAALPSLLTARAHHSLSG